MALLKGTRLPLFLWRSQGVLWWLVQHITPRRLWSRYLVPGKLVVATLSAAAADAVTSALHAQSRRSLFRVESFQSLCGPLDASAPTTNGESPRAGSSMLAGAWTITVPRGCEIAVLRELEYRVALALEREGDYTGIDRRLSLKIARSTIAAHQARRLRLSAPVAVSGERTVQFDEATHALYRSMVATGPDPTSDVDVAILDSAVDLAQVPERLRMRVVIAEVNDEIAALPRSTHGAVTASIIADLAARATVHVYPVWSGGVTGVQDENVLMLALHQVREAGFPVIAMCLKVAFPPGYQGWKTRRECVGMTLQGLSDHQVVVVASGNREPPDIGDEATFPATCARVLMVAAIDSRRELSAFSKYRLGDTRPKLFVVAPGGRDPMDAVPESPATVGSERFWGTSLAAAYAAGVIARAVGCLPPGHPRPKLQDVVDAINAARDDDLPSYTEERYGVGMLRQPDLTRSAPAERT